MRLHEVMLGLRRTLIERLDNPQVRRDALRELATEEALGVLDAGGAEAVVQWLLARHPSPHNG